MKRPTRYYSNKQEKAVADTFKGRTQINSGATPFYKGDVKNDIFLFECKTCTEQRKSFSIKKEWLDVIRREAFEDRRFPVLAFNFGDEENYYIIDERLMKLLNKLIRDSYD